MFRKLIPIAFAALALASCATPRANIEMAAYAAEAKAGAQGAAERMHNRTVTWAKASYEAEVARINAKYAALVAEATGLSDPAEATKLGHQYALDQSRELQMARANFENEVRQANWDLESSRIYSEAALDIVKMQRNIDLQRQSFAQETVAQTVAVAGEFYTKLEQEEARVKAEKARLQREADLALREAEAAMLMQEAEAAFAEAGSNTNSEATE